MTIFSRESWCTPKSGSLPITNGYELAWLVATTIDVDKPACLVWDISDVQFLLGHRTKAGPLLSAMRAGVDMRSVADDPLQRSDPVEQDR